MSLWSTHEQPIGRLKIISPTAMIMPRLPPIHPIWAYTQDLKWHIGRPKDIVLRHYALKAECMIRTLRRMLHLYTSFLTYTHGDLWLAQDPLTCQDLLTCMPCVTMWLVHWLEMDADIIAGDMDATCHSLIGLLIWHIIMGCQAIIFLFSMLTQPLSLCTWLDQKSGTLLELTFW